MRPDSGNCEKPYSYPAGSEKGHIWAWYPDAPVEYKRAGPRQAADRLLPPPRQAREAADTTFRLRPNEPVITYARPPKGKRTSQGQACGHQRPGIVTAKEPGPRIARAASEADPENAARIRAWLEKAKWGRGPATS